MRLFSILRTGPFQRFWRSGFSLALLTALAACAVAKNPLTDEQIATLDIVEINVLFEPDVNISWADGRAEYAALKGCERPDEVDVSDGYNAGNADLAEGECDYEAFVNTPEAEAFLKAKITETVTKRFNTQVRDKISGTEPARLDILFEQVIVISEAQGFLLGGQHFLDTGFTVVDISSGKPIATYPDLLVAAGPGAAGLLRLVDGERPDVPLDALAANFAVFTEKWLTNTLE